MQRLPRQAMRAYEIYDVNPSHVTELAFQLRDASTERGVLRFYFFWPRGLRRSCEREVSRGRKRQQSPWDEAHQGVHHLLAKSQPGDDAAEMEPP